MYVIVLLFFITVGSRGGGGGAGGARPSIFGKYFKKSPKLAKIYKKISGAPPFSDLESATVNLEQIT